MKRRALLALGTGIALGGCLGNRHSPSIRIDSIRLSNNRTEPYEIEVWIESNDEEVFRNEYRLGTGPESSTMVIHDPVNGKKHYELLFRADGQTDIISPSEYDDINGECVAVQYELHQQNTRGFNIQQSEGC